jgi:hypothetical protein
MFSNANCNNEYSCLDIMHIYIYIYIYIYMESIHILLNIYYLFSKFGTWVQVLTLSGNLWKSRCVNSYVIVSRTTAVICQNIGADLLCILMWSLYWGEEEYNNEEGPQEVVPKNNQFYDTSHDSWVPPSNITRSSRPLLFNWNWSWFFSFILICFCGEGHTHLMCIHLTLLLTNWNFGTWLVI